MKHITGDILEVERGIICHQVNCQRVAGAGLAKQIDNKFSFWKEWFVDIKHKHLGDVAWYVIHDELIIASLYAQDGYGYDKRYTNYAALAKCLWSLRGHQKQIYIPRGMGCGLGGGDWNIVSQLIEDALPNAIIVERVKTTHTQGVV